MVFLATPKLSASSRSGGILLPSDHSPESIRALSDFAMPAAANRAMDVYPNVSQ
jgi:hypothetical protein